MIGHGNHGDGRKRAGAAPERATIFGHLLTGRRTSQALLNIDSSVFLGVDSDALPSAQAAAGARHR